MQAHDSFLDLWSLSPAALHATARIMAVVIAAAAQATPLCCRPLNEFQPRSCSARHTRRKKRRRRQLPEALRCPQTYREQGVKGLGDERFLAGGAHVPRTSTRSASVLHVRRSSSENGCERTGCRATMNGAKAAAGGGEGERERGREGERERERGYLQAQVLVALCQKSRVTNESSEK